MSGIRLQASAEYVGVANLNIVHHRRYTEPLFCAECDAMHEYKTYHLKLDSQGQVTVSETIYERLAELEGLPLRRIGIDAHPEPQVIQVAPGLQAPARTIVPTVVVSSTNGRKVHSG